MMFLSHTGADRSSKPLPTTVTYVDRISTTYLTQMISVETPLPFAKL